MTEYVAITEGNLAKFDSLLLPQLLTKLQQLGDRRDTDNGTLLALGALRGDDPAGALVAILEPSGDIELLSLFVAEQYWCSGVATGLLDSLLRVASGCYVGERDGDANCITIKASYLLTDKQLARFRPFLESVGMDTFVEEGYSYGIDSTALTRCYLLRQAFQQAPPSDAHVVLLASLTTDQRLELLEDTEDGDFLDEDKRDWSYCYCEGERVTDLLLAERGYASSIILHERGALDGSDSRSLLALLVQVLHTAHNALGEFRLYVEGDDVLDTDMLDYLIHNGATHYCKQLAWGKVMLY